MNKLFLYAIIACITSAMPMNVKAAEAYAALSNDNTTLTFYYDNEKSSRNGMDIGPFAGKDERGWHKNCNHIKIVAFDNSFSHYTELSSTAYWFYDCSNLEAIEGMEYLKTDEVTDMKMMFLYCTSLTSINLSKFNTSVVS